MDASVLDQFRQAVLLSFDVQADAQLRSQANASLEALKGSEEVWSFCLAAFTASGEDRVQFWCLQALVDAAQGGRFAQLGEDTKASVRSSLEAYVASLASSSDSETTPPYVRNKFSQLYVALMRAEYPVRWPTPFEALLASLPLGAAAVDLFLRVLQTVHEDIVSSEVSTFDAQAASRVKDAMREQCVSRVVEALYSLLAQLPLGEGVAPPPWAEKALGIAAHYTVWVDIGLLGSPRFLALYASLLQQPPLHEGACHCLRAVVEKRMEPAPKLQHLQSIRAVEMLSAAHEGMVARGRPLTEPFAALVAQCSLELLDVWDRLSQRGGEAAGEGAADLLRASMPLLLAALASDGLEVSSSTMPFLHAYLGRLRKLLPAASAIAQHEAHLQQLLVQLARRSVHPDGAAGLPSEDPDDDETSFADYRREVSTLFRSAARVHPSLACAFVKSTLQSVLGASDAERPEGVQWSHVEVALWLLYLLGEGLPEATTREKGGPFGELMLALLSSSAASHPHAAVSLQYLEIVVRYYRFFLQQPALLPDTLRSFLGARGIRSPQQALRSRACQLLLRFVKQTLKSATATQLEIAASLVDTLQRQPAPRSLRDGGGGGGNGADGGEPVLSDAEELCLYEACGLLLGSGLASEEQAAAAAAKLSELLALPMNQLQALCQTAPPPAAAAAAASAPSLCRQDGSAVEAEERRAMEAAHRIAVIAAVSKGFSSLAHAGTRDAFTAAIQLCLASLGPLGSSGEVRAKTVTLLHRMVETFALDVLGALQPALPHLLRASDAKEIAAAVALVNQIVLKFKGSVAASVSPVVAALSAAVFAQLAALEGAVAAEVGGGGGASMSEGARERHALLRGYFTFLHSLVHCDLAAVLCDANNLPLLDAALGRLLQGCVEGPDLTLQRQCFAVLQKLVEHLGGADETFDTYIRERMLPACFGALSQPHFRLADAAALQLLEAVAALQVAMLAKLGRPFAAHLHDVYLPQQLQCSPAFCDEYAALLAAGEPRALRDFLRSHLLAAGGGKS
mmetsp:Transcript_24876/g.73923  ORF Transcript_24876/g.73923 Transcript_24876/m.73923 type:complete len:1024 (+) Transcript_24876:116-3187(+)